MASHIFPRFVQLLSFSMSCKPSSITSGILVRASGAVVSVLSRALSSKPEGARRSHAFNFEELICSAVLNDKNAGESFLFQSPRSGENVLESVATSSTCNGEKGLWSVIIPTYNRLPILRKCLEALEEQEGYEHSGIEDYEVVVVDDGSTDGTLEFLQPILNSVEVFREKPMMKRSQGNEANNVLNENLSSSPIPGHTCDGTSVQSSRVFPHVKIIRQHHGGMN